MSTSKPAAANNSAPPPRKKSILQTLFGGLGGARRDSAKSRKETIPEEPPPPAALNGALAPATGPGRPHGSAYRAKVSQSARLPSHVLSSTIREGGDAAAAADALFEEEFGYAERRRAESDPTPECASTLGRDFGFPDPNSGDGPARARGGGGGGGGGGADGRDAEPQELDLLLTRLPSKLDVVEGRRASFNKEDRTSVNRRSLQLSSRLGAAGGGPSTSLLLAGGGGADESGAVDGAWAGSGRLKAATLTRLVEYVVTSNEFMEASQLSGFLLTYHAYVDAHGLLSALAARYDLACEKRDVVAQIRTLFVLQKWIDDHWYDFEDDDLLLLGVARFAQSRLSGARADADRGVLQLLSRLSGVAALSKQSSPSLGGAASPRAAAANSHDNDNESGDEADSGAPGASAAATAATAAATAPTSATPQWRWRRDNNVKLLSQRPPPLVPRDWPAPLTKALGKAAAAILASSWMNKVEIARQLTLVEHEMFRGVAPTELIAQATHKLDSAPEHLRQVIAHFNAVTRFVAGTICFYPDLRDRALMYRKWIKIGVALLLLNNYNGVFEVMAGVHSVAVWRLKHTRAAQSAKTKRLQEQLEGVVSRKNNYATYRELLGHNTVPVQPSVPFIGASLADLSFLDLGTTDTVGEDTHGDTLINFTKHRRVAQVIQVVRKFQDHPYALEEVKELREFLEREIDRPAKRLSDDDLFRMSLACEAGARVAERGGAGAGLAAAAMG